LDNKSIKGSWTMDAQLGSWKNEIQKLQSKIIGQTMDLRKWNNEWTCESFAEVREQLNLVKWNNGWTHGSETLDKTEELGKQMNLGEQTMDGHVRAGQ
jgi:uncharacterized Zn finger protein